MLLLAACKNEPPALMVQVKQALADRDARLGSYHLMGQTTDGTQQVAHEFFFRSPNKMRAVMKDFEWSFDGQRLYKLQREPRVFTTFELTLPKDQAAVMLHSTFSPFVLEGFRTPLMPLKGVAAVLVDHPKGPRAVELRIEPGDGVGVTYVLRWPGADFLERRSESDAGVGALKIEEEQCDETAKLCVPTVAVEYVDGKKVLTTRLTTVELNGEIPADAFAPGAPKGWAVETREVSEK